jgi:hypothetical protein
MENSHFAYRHHAGAPSSSLPLPLDITSQPPPPPINHLKADAQAKDAPEVWGVPYFTQKLLQVPDVLHGQQPQRLPVSLKQEL